MQGSLVMTLTASWNLRIYVRDARGELPYIFFYLISSSSLIRGPRYSPFSLTPSIDFLLSLTLCLSPSISHLLPLYLSCPFTLCYPKIIQTFRNSLTSYGTIHACIIVHCADKSYRRGGNSLWWTLI